MKRLTPILLAVLPALAISLHPLSNNDLPLHLAIGEWILSEGRLPHTDPFSFTAPDVPWVPHEWLAAVIFAAIESQGGALALTGLMLLLTVLIAGSHRALAAELGVIPERYLLWCIPLWVVVGPRLILRPHLFVLILVLLQWWILLRARRRPALLWLLPVLMAFWVNVHGSFTLGFAIIALDFLFGDREHPGSWIRRAGVFAVTLATLFLQVHVYYQPDPWAALRHPFELVSDPVFMQNIQEWQAPFSAEGALFRTTVPFALSLPWIGLAAIGLWQRRRVIPRSYFLFVLVTLLLYFRHQRFLALFALVSFPVLPMWTLPFNELWRRWAPRLAVVVVSLLFVYPGYPYYWSAPPRRSGFGWDEKHLPFVPVRALEAIEYWGPVLCEYHYGGLVAWQGAGRLRISMDSRNSVYGADLFKLHQNALAVDSWIAQDERRRDQPEEKAALAFRQSLLRASGAVLIESPVYNPYRRGLCEVLDRDPDWKMVREITDESGRTARMSVRRHVLYVKLGKPK